MNCLFVFSILYSLFNYLLIIVIFIESGGQDGEESQTGEGHARSLGEKKESQMC